MTDISTEKEQFNKFYEMLRYFDETTAEHSRRVAESNYLLARELGLSDEMCKIAYGCGIFHDAGKISVPIEIIDSKSKLTDEQFEIIKTHPKLGIESLYDLKKANWNIRPEYFDAAGNHHKGIDGSGYGVDEKPAFYAQLTAISDVSDALSNARSYKKAWTDEEVINELINSKKLNQELCKVYIEKVFPRIHSNVVEVDYMVSNDEKIGLPKEFIITLSRVEEPYKILFKEEDIKSFNVEKLMDSCNKVFDDFNMISMPNTIHALWSYLNDYKKAQVTESVRNEVLTNKHSSR